MAGRVADGNLSMSRVRVIDFRRPSKFPRELVRRLEHAHEAFCRSAATRLSAELRGAVRLGVSGADQLPWVAAIEEAPADSLVAVLELESHRRCVALVVELPLAVCIVDRMLGGGSQARTETSAGLTDVEVAILRRGMASLVEPLSSIWLDLAGTDLAVREIESSPVSVQLAPPSEPTLVIEMAMSVADLESRLLLLLPHRSVDPVLRRLSRADEDGSPDDGHSEHAVRAAMQGVEVELHAEVGAVELTLADVRALRPGDVLRLRRRADDGVVVRAGDVAAYVAAPGRNGRARAVQVRRRSS